MRLKKFLPSASADRVEQRRLDPACTGGPASSDGPYGGFGRVRKVIHRFRRDQAVRVEAADAFVPGISGLG